MKRNPYKILLSWLVILSSAIVAHAQSYSYSNAVAALNPVAYWPLDETNQGPPAYVATNSGTLGAQANGYYGNDYYASGSTYTLSTLFTGPVAGPTSDGSAAAQFNGGANNNDNSEYVIIPDDNQVLDKGPVPFSAECWVMPEGGDPNDVTGTSFASSEFTGLMKKGGGIAFYTENGDTHNNTYGWTVSLTGIYGMGPPGGWYGGFSAGEFLLTNAAWVVDFYNGANGNTPALEFDVPMSEPTPQWFHLMLTYDGTNANFYTNGALAATTVLGLPQSTNHIIAPGQLFVSATGAYQFKLNGNGQGYVPDTINPFCVGNNNESASSQNGGWPQTNNFTGFNCQNFNGALADVAVYTNALSAATALKHYQDATGAPTLYTNDVLSANPPIFLRFNEPAYTEPAFSTFAVANSYGTAGASLNGSYQPGVLSGVPGDVAAGLGPVSRAAQMNGLDAGVDVGGGILFGSDLDPQNANNGGLLPSFSVAFLCKGNPADCYGRFETILGRGDSAWRFDMDQSGNIHWNPGAGPEIHTPENFNDGLWHYVVGVCDGSSGTALLYVDGNLTVTNNGAGALNGSSEDLLIGGAPDYTTDNNNNQRYFPGGIAEVAFFTNALTAGQIDTLFNAAILAPQIIQEPAANTVIGLDAFGSLTVGSLGSDLNYQWYVGTTALTDAGNISGSATATLTITDAQLTNAGAYYVVVGNAAGSVTSSVANVTISQVPTFLQQPPANVTRYPGNTASFIVEAVGASPITYQWYNGSSAIGGATSSNITIAATLGTTTFDCVAQNSFGSTTSSVVTVVGQAPPKSLVVNYSVITIAAVYSGQGAFSDPGNNKWNLFAASGIESGNAVNSAGAPTVITATLDFGFNNGSVNGVTNGTPSYLLCDEDAVNSGAPGIGTSTAPEGQLTINDLPQGKYELYLYSANYDDNRGSVFTLAPANPGVADLGSNGCVNGCITGAVEHGGTNRFAEGDNYVLFDDVVPDTNGDVTVTFVPNPNGVLTGEAPFDGFQLVEIVPPVMSVKNQGGGNDVVSWAPAIGQLLSSSNAAGPYSVISGASSPYTNSVSGAPQQFFRVNVP